MSSEPLTWLVLWLLAQQKGAKQSPVWPTPADDKTKIPGTPDDATTAIDPLPGRSPAFKPYPAPIPPEVIATAQSLLRTLPKGKWKQDGQVIYRHELHAPGRWGITAYV